MRLSHSLLNFLQEAGMSGWAEQLPKQVDARMDAGRYGDLPSWQAVIDSLPDIEASQINLAADAVQVGAAQDLSLEQQSQLRTALMGLHPWRKGPFELFGIHIDTEWHSDWKWNRVSPHITPLKGRTVLDVGSGNGYYALRMHGAGARRVIGADPTPVFVMQYQVFQKYLGEIPVDILPLALEDLPQGMQAFDTVFSMGVLYHRRSPLDHLYALKDCLTPGGELILETLVIEGDERHVLMPEGRYAKMRNTWFIPSVSMLEIWLQRCGFRDVRLVDVNQTSTQEQRSTEWMTFESLSDFLDRRDQNLTVEGYPAPVRATLVAHKPE